MSTYGSIAFVDQQQGYVVEVNGPDMMYSGRGKEICNILTKIRPQDLKDSRNLEKILYGTVMYVNYLRAKNHERSIKEMFKRDFLEQIGFTGAYWEFKTEPIKKVPLPQSTIVNGDGSEWTYVKNISDKPVVLPVYASYNYKEPKYLYELEPYGVCCLNWGNMPKGNNMYNRNLKLVREY